MNRVESWGGSFWIGGTTLTTLNGKGERLKSFALIAQEDTVIDILEGTGPNDENVDFIELFGLDTSSPSPTIKAGALIKTEKGYSITRVKLASGSIITYH